MHSKQIIKLLSYILIVLCFAMLFPLLVAFFNNEQTELVAFRNTIICTLIPALIVSFCIKKNNLSGLSQKDGYLFTVLTWVLAAAIGAVPLVISGHYLTYSDAFFEVMSGLTTTGSTTLNNIDNCSRSILLWRSMTNWLGGMGIVVLFIALLPALGAGGGAFNLIGAETVGPVKGKLTPKTRTTARSLWLIYLALTALHVLALLIGKVPAFDAITIAFSTMSTAGFCIKGASIGAYSNYVQVVVTIFMLLAGINFSLFFMALTGKLRDVFKDKEFKWYLSIFACATIIGTVGLLVFNGQTFGSSLRQMAFQVASVMTTTGYTSTDFIAWPSVCIMVLVLMMFVGGSAGSTGGGMKVTRVSTLLNTTGNIIRKKVHPTAVFEKDNENTLNIFSFCAIYMITWLVGAFVLSFAGLTVEGSLSTSICCLGNIGVGFSDLTNQSLSYLPAWSKYFCSFLMLAGRLELFTIYALFTRK